MEYIKLRDERSSSHVMTEVMICVENEIKVEGGKVLPKNRNTTPPRARVE